MTVRGLRARGDAVALAAVLTLGVAWREGLAAAWPNLYWPDEIFQSVEQAYRLVFDYGIVPWEFRQGARSWLLPGLLAVPMGLGSALGPTMALAATRLALALLGVTPAAAAFAWARPSSGRWGAVFAAAAVTVWSELSYFSTKGLSEVVAADLLLVGLLLAWRPPEAEAAPSSSRARAAWAGLALGLTAAVRVQLAPAVAVVFAWAALEEHQRRRGAFLGAGLLAVALAGGVDLLTWGAPFVSYVRSFEFNIATGQSARWGVLPWHQYLLWLTEIWGPALLALGALCVLAARRMALPLAGAVIILVSHSLVAHKEYRFIFPALVVIVVVAAVELARRLAPGARRRPWLGAVAGAAWLALSVNAAGNLQSDVTGSHLGGGPAQSHWTRLGDTVEAFAALSHREELCGVGLWHLPWYATPGYSGLGRNVPLLLIEDPEALAAATPFVNVLVSRGPTPETLGGFHRERCFGFTCIFGRPGPCEPGGPDINVTLRARGE